MTLTDWLRRLERLHYKAIDMGLERVSQVAQRSGLFSNLPFIITVGGTNGKGSTVAFLDSLLRAHGYRVGLYTSPHLIDFNERVVVDGQPVADDTLVAAFEWIDAARQDTSLTYFEFTTLAAMWVFQQSALDVIVLEVGLGGRLDAVNIWDADIAAVTSIDLDHQQFLGDTREKIGLEKIGIGRANRPLIMGEPQLPALVGQAAQSLGLILYQIDQAFSVESGVEGRWHFRGVDAQSSPISYVDLPATRLYQRNAAIALQILALAPFNLNRELILQALANAELTGRQQIVQDQPQVMLDVGHNPHAAAHLARCLRQMKVGRIRCVVGMLRDKAVADTLAELLDVVDVWYPVTLDGERGLSGESIRQQLLEGGASAPGSWKAPSSAYRHLIKNSAPEDLILVFGSFYTVADVIQYRRSIDGKG